MQEQACLRVSTLLFLAMSSLGAESAEVDFFERHVRPVLANQCYACHGAQLSQPQAGLRVDSREALLMGGKSGPALVPGDPDGSLLLQVLRHTGEIRMPPTGRLTDTQVDRIASWVRMGAPFPSAIESTVTAGDVGGNRHWAFALPVKADLPEARTDWAQTPIDQFVEARLVQAGLGPSPEAHPRTLLRRVYYDLTGLPPSADEIDAFVRSPTREAYAAIVESLLASPHFGERWARHWLDIVRYSDEGFQARPFAISWTYRDWVVSAFNRDLPYDQFILRQLAADLIDSDRRDLAALGMLTVGINLPRPTDVPENLDDRIDVVTRGFLGLSVACARCHDHKFDPIPQADYYSLYGVFLNSPDVLDPVPIEAFPPGRDTEFFRNKLSMRREWLDRYRSERLQDHVREFRAPETLARYLENAWKSREYSNRDVEALSKEQDLNLYVLNRWRAYLSGLVGPSVEAFAMLDSPGGAAALADRIAEADSAYRWPDPEREAFRLALRGNGSPTDIPIHDFWWVQNEGDSNVMKSLKWQHDAVMRDWGARGGPEHAMVVEDARTLRPAFVFQRGNQHDKGERVRRRFLSALPGPSEFDDGSGRLELARAIATAGNPLTVRVLVNRVWGHLLGEGIVRTPSDFGLRGDAPSHPELLDHLAVEFVENGWSVKDLVRRIVHSQTYRQDSVNSETGFETDPDNRLLWRQNPVRLDFEALRDSMLAVAGELDGSVGGAPFDLTASPTSRRRTLYAYVSREEPSALMRTFDFSNPEEHTPKRQLTTVPQQALFFMNNSFLAERARALAQACPDEDRCIERLHQRILGRPPTQDELRDARAFLAGPNAELPASTGGPAASGAWMHGTAKLDAAKGMVRNFRVMQYRVEDRLQPAPMLPAPRSGRASLSAVGGHPGDSLDSAVVRRWTAPEAIRVSVQGELKHSMGDQARRFEFSNGVRGWIVSSEHGVLASWRVKGFDVDTGVRNLDLGAGGHLDFAVDALGDYESDSFQWSPEIVETLTPQQQSAGMEPRRWSAEDDFPDPSIVPLGPFERYAQVLLMTNEFAFRD